MLKSKGGAEEKRKNWAVKIRGDGPKEKIQR